MASKLQTKVIKDLEKNGYFVINLIRSNVNGIADLLALKENEKPLFIECKEKNDTVKPLQLFRGRQVEKYGCEFQLIQVK
jgi:Holliday junction resolvase